jgi:hypothetical protein
VPLHGHRTQLRRVGQQLGNSPSSLGVDVLGVESLATHRLPLSQAPEAYKMFRDKEDGCIKVVLKPTAG